MGVRRKLALVTGGTRGLGHAAAVRLAGLGYRVVLTGREAQGAEEAAARARLAAGAGEARGMELDLASPRSVRAFAERFSREEGPLDVLVANAASMPGPTPRYTEGGVELTFAANHLGHFLLASRLLPRLEAAVAETGEARVVVVSSRLHKPGSMGPRTRLDLDDVSLRRGYRPMVAYKNSKLANVLFAYELDRRVFSRGVRANALCPNFVPETAAAAGRGLARLLYRHLLPLLPFAKTVDEAVDTYEFVAADPRLRGVGGRFYGERREIASSPESYDRGLAARLWRLSEALTGERPWVEGA